MAWSSDLVLASASPRRLELLKQIGVVPDVQPADVDETPAPGEAPSEYVLRTALAKARTIATGLPQADFRAVLAADSAVVADRRILGKPAGRAEAVEHLRLLSGRDHKVLTGVAVVHRHAEETRLSVSHVRFRPVGEDEIAAYWNTGEPAGKAGSYAVQGIAAVFIEEIRGSYSGIMGLPLFETAELLRAAGCAMSL